MKIIPLSEGAFTVDKTKAFVPFNKASDDLQQRATGSMLVEVQPFAVITGQDVLLIDAGLGFKENNGRLQIHHNLIQHGINPASVTKVLMSHLHKDHSGGISYLDEDSGERKLSFPDATYYVNRKEFDFGMSKENTPSYHKEDFELLGTAANVVFTNEAGVIDDYIKYEMSGAHCPYHQEFWITKEGNTTFFGGDIAPQLQQMKNRFIAKYDYDGKKCMELRRQWWAQGQQEHWTFLFYHDIKTPVAAF